MDSPADVAALPPGFTLLRDYIAKLESEPGGKERLDHARRTLAAMNEIVAENKRLSTENASLVERVKVAEGDAAALRKFVDSNMTFMDVDADWPVEGPNIPTLAQVSNRIWYHATDDQTSYPFSAVIDAALAAKESPHG